MEQRLRKGHPETAPPRNPSHLQTPNPHTIADAKKRLLTGPDSYRCRYSQPTIGLSPGTPLEELWGRTEGAEGDCNPTGRTISTNWTTQSSQGLNHQSKSIQGGTQDSSYICSRGWSYLTSMGGEGGLMPQCRGMLEG